VNGQFRGVFAIPPTPFSSGGEIDETGLRRCIRFCIEAGCHGIVYPANASEFGLLADDERIRVMEIVMEEAKGQVPVVLGITGTSIPVARRFARTAGALEADGILAMPPYVVKAEDEALLEYYQEIDREVDVPIFLQNSAPPLGTPMSPEVVIRIVRNTEHVTYVKEETDRAVTYIGRLLSYHEPKLAGVMGGKGGRDLIREYRKGACGTMPACELADILVLIWGLLEQEDWAQARHVHARILPIICLEMDYGPDVYKEILRRRGILETADTRILTDARLDPTDAEHLDQLLWDIQDLFRIHPPVVK
jgi:dihydrodipicolinate synthase/N-acetylneuraminate lyase